MRTKTLPLLIAIICLFAFSCNKDKTATISFYTKSSAPCGNIKIDISGEIKTLSEYVNSTPECMGEGTANFQHLEPGTYKWAAVDQCGSWDGEIILEKGDCKQIELQ